MRIEWVFIWTNLNSLHPRMHCSRFGWNWSTSWEEDFLKFRQSSFEQIWVPSTKGCIVPSLVEIDPVVLAKKMKMWKVYANDDNDDDDDDGQRTNFDQKSLLEPSAKKVSLNYLSEFESCYWLLIFYVRSSYMSFPIKRKINIRIYFCHLKVSLILSYNDHNIHL